MAEKKRRRWWIAILVAAALVTAVATLSEASSNRPLRYYSEDGFTAMTFYTNSSGDQNRSLWGINTDDPQCELDINGTICINRTGVYVYGVNLTPGSSGAPTGATYLTLSLDAGLSAERVLTAGNGITFTDTGANGVLRINLTGLQACSSGNVSMWDGSQWNCVNLTTSGSSNTFGYGLNVSGNHITIANLTACNPVTEYSVWDGTEWSCDNDGVGTDTNNYTSNISFNVTGSNYQLNLERVGMSNLTANFTIPTSGSGSGNITGSLVAGEGVYSFNATHLTTNKILYVQPNNGSDIQAKINQCPSSGCEIVIPSGNYTTNSQINVIYDNIHIKGTSSTNIITNHSNAAIHITKKNVLIENLNIFSNNTTGIQFYTNSEDGKVLLTKIYNSDKGIRGFETKRLTVENNYINNSYSHGIEISSSEEVKITGNDIILTNYSSGVYFVNSNNSIVSNNYIENSGYGGIWFWTDNKNALVNENIINNYRDGSGIRYWNSTTGVISNNVIINGVQAGILVFDNTTVVGNYINNLGVGPIAGGVGINLQGNNSIASSNTISNISDSGIIVDGGNNLISLNNIYETLAGNNASILIRGKYNKVNNNVARNTFIGVLEDEEGSNNMYSLNTFIGTTINYTINSSSVLIQNTNFFSLNKQTFIGSTIDEPLALLHLKNNSASAILARFDRDGTNYLDIIAATGTPSKVEFRASGSTSFYVYTASGSRGNFEIINSSGNTLFLTNASSNKALFTGILNASDFCNSTICFSNMQTGNISNFNVSVNDVPRMINSTTLVTGVIKDNGTDVNITTSANRAVLHLYNTFAGRSAILELIRPGVGGLFFTGSGGTPSASIIGTVNSAGTQNSVITIGTATHVNFTTGDLAIGNGAVLSTPAIFVAQNRTSVGIGNSAPNFTLDIQGTAAINGSQLCMEDGTNCPSAGAGNVTGSNGTAGLPAVWSSASNLIASLISNFMIGDKAVNSSQLNTSNAGSSGQYLMLNSTGGMDWNTITTGGSSLTSFNITNLTGQFNASLTFDNGTTYYAMGSLPASGSGSGNLTGNITSGYIPYATNNTHFENSRLTQNATANTVAGDWFVNNYVQDRTNQNYMNILETEFCPGNLVNNAPYDGFTGSSISSGIVGSIQANQSHPCILGMGDSTTANGGVMIRTGADAFRLNGTENATFIWKQQATQDQFIRTIMGFFDTSNMAEPTDGCMFYMQMNNHSGQNNQLSGRCVSNSVSSNTSNNYTFTNNTWYITKIEINNIATNVTFKVYNESGSLLWNNSVGTNIPVAVGRETGFGVITSQNNTDASITYMHMDYMGLLIKRQLRSIVYNE